MLLALYLGSRLFKEGVDMLRKTKELNGSKLHARDGEIGHLKDFYFVKICFDVGPQFS